MSVRSKYEDELDKVFTKLVKMCHATEIAIEKSIKACNLTTTDFAGYCAGKTDKGEITRSLRYEEFIALNTYEIQKLKKRVDELESMLKVNDAS